MTEINTEVVASYLIAKKYSCQQSNKLLSKPLNHYIATQNSPLTIDGIDRKKTFAFIQSSATLPRALPAHPALERKRLSVSSYNPKETEFKKIPTAIISVRNEESSPNIITSDARESIDCGYGCQAVGLNSGGSRWK